MRFPQHAPQSAKPLRLPVERYVHCPRQGGLVQLRACGECELMQGTLVDDGLVVLCAHPQPVPALHAFKVGPCPEAMPHEGGPRPPATSTVAAPGLRSRLIFETDWPDDE
jgi:hypothetical protein